MVSDIEEKMIEDMNIKIMGSLSYLLLLRKTLKESGMLKLYPLFDDPTIAGMLEARQSIEDIRGY